MPLIGDQQDDDRVQIADLVVSKMNQTIARISSSHTVRSTSGQPLQVLKRLSWPDKILGLSFKMEVNVGSHRPQTSGCGVMSECG